VSATVFGASSGQTPLTPPPGQFSASIPPIAYALFGSSRQLNVAPEAALSLLVGQAVTSALQSDPHHPPPNPEAVGLAVATAITVQACIYSTKPSHRLLTLTQVGLISFALGFFRLGFIDVVLSRALLRGFVAAVAFIILLSVHPVALHAPSRLMSLLENN
jgi:MFS superfamily sulfate permease-like transporter